MSTELILNSQRYPLDWLRHTPDKIPWDSLTPYEIEVLQFCQQWLSGQQAFVVHTSGSTGQPKDVTLSRAQMQHSAQLTGQALGLQAGDKALVCLAVWYIAGLMMLVRGFELGLQLTLVEPTSNPLNKFSSDAAFDFTAFVPLQLQHILTDSPNKVPILNRMKAILVGGAPVSAALQAQLQSITAPVYHTYGMTETVTHIALKRLNGPERSDFFKPLAGVQLGVDERGCLTVQSTLTKGETLYTNDRVDLRPDGSFKWLGRIDHVINSGGVKVQIEMIESALEEVFYRYQDGRFARRRFFVGPVEDDRLGQAAVAIIEGRPFSQQTESEIRTALQKSLSRYETPRRFYFTEKLLETPTGKIDRLANLKRNFTDEGQMGWESL